MPQTPGASMGPRHTHLLVLLLAGSALAVSALVAGRTGAQPAADKDTRGGAFFEKEVLPILKANCFECHGGAKRRGGLSLASRKGLLAGGGLGPAVSLDKPGDSLLLKAIH